MNYNMIFNENDKICERISEEKKKLDKYLEKEKKIYGMVKRYDNIEELKKEITNIIDSEEIKEIEEDIYEFNEEANEIIQYMNAINLRILTQQTMMNLDKPRIYAGNWINPNWNILNEVMNKILGLHWCLNTNSSFPTISGLLNDNKKIFDFMCSLQKIRYIKDVYINIESFIKDINCNYGESKEII